MSQQTLHRRLDAIRLSNGLDPRQADWQEMDAIYDQLNELAEAEARAESEARARREHHKRALIQYRAERQAFTVSS